MLAVLTHDTDDHIRDPLPDGFRLIPKDALSLVNGGLRFGTTILANEAGCWHARIRNREYRRYGRERRWLWAAEVDPGSVRRYRRRAWASATGTEVPGGCTLGTSCGDPRCISPYHLTIAARPLPVDQAPKEGRWEWFEEEDEDTGEVVESCLWIEGGAPAVSAVRDWSRILIRPKPERKDPSETRGERHHKAKLTKADARAIRAAHAEGTSMYALARRYGVSAPSIRDIIARKTWRHVA